MIAPARASREALDNPSLATVLASLPTPEPTVLANELPPLMTTRIDSPEGELSFLSTFTTFGMPQDITVASLRIEHLIPAEPHTWNVMTRLYACTDEVKVTDHDPNKRRCP